MTHSLVSIHGEGVRGLSAVAALEHDAVLEVAEAAAGRVEGHDSGDQQDEVRGDDRRGVEALGVHQRLEIEQIMLKEAFLALQNRLSKKNVQDCQKMPKIVKTD